jgi:hypothetical protein
MMAQLKWETGDMQRLWRHTKTIEEHFEQCHRPVKDNSILSTSTYYAEE